MRRHLLLLAYDPYLALAAMPVERQLAGNEEGFLLTCRLTQRQLLLSVVRYRWYIGMHIRPHETLSTFMAEHGETNSPH